MYGVTYSLTDWLVHLQEMLTRIGKRGTNTSQYCAFPYMSILYFPIFFYRHRRSNSYNSTCRRGREHSSQGGGGGRRRGSSKATILDGGAGKNGVKLALPSPSPVGGGPLTPMATSPSRALLQHNGGGSKVSTVCGAAAEEHPMVAAAEKVKSAAAAAEAAVAGPLMPRRDVEPADLRLAAANAAAAAASSSPRAKLLAGAAGATHV